MSNITFIALTESHFPLLLKWLETPHVKAWWDADIRWTPALIQEKYGSYVKGYKLDKGIAKKLNAYIICVDGVPIGYIQIYNGYDFTRVPPLTSLPSSLGGFDVFIGDEHYLGQGIGPKAIKQFLETYGTAYFYIFADPDPANIVAIRAYEKAGFKKIKEQPYPNELWMIRENIHSPLMHAPISIQTASHFLWGDHCDGWWLKKNGRLTVLSERMPSGTAEGKHFHNEAEQFFYVLDGEMSIELDNIYYHLEPHEGITIPPQMVHKVYNHSDQDLRFLVISSPDAHEDRVNVEA